MKTIKLTKIRTSELNLHVSQASKGDSEKKVSELLSEILSDTNSLQDGLGQNQRATALNQAM